MMTEFGAAQSASFIATLLARPESRTLDFKRISAKHPRMIETVCAFANGEGGALVIGVGDAKDMQAGAKPESRLFGIEENPEAFDDFHRQVMAKFTPPIDRLHWLRLPCTLNNGQPGHVVLLRVEKSATVHSITGHGTWARMDASNRQMNASEIAELHYRRGTRSAAAEAVPISLELLQTGVWGRFAAARGLTRGTFAEQLQRIGLAQMAGAECQPLRAAVLLFADEPGSLLAAHGSRADVRVMVYDGKQAVPGATPNLRKPARTVRGPLIDQIDATIKLVLDELVHGLTLSASGFKGRHVYPERVVKEAIVNAVIHRDYRLNRDIFVRIFDDRIEVESPGAFPGSITPTNIGRAGSFPRNSLLAQNLREFPVAPNIDAGEGVPMMFAEMKQANLYPPQYRQSVGAAVETVTVTLRNLSRPSAWDQVSDWVDQQGSIANADVVRIAEVDTLKASKMLKGWCDAGLLEPLPGRAKRNMAYTKQVQDSQDPLFSTTEDNNA